MAKRARKPHESRSSSPSSTSADATDNVSSQDMVLKMKSNDNLRRSTRQRVVRIEKQERLKSVMKSKTKVKKKNGKLDAKKPKKPPTAFFYYLEDFRKEFQVQNPDIKSMRDVGKACGEKWKTMSYEEKVKYYDIATEKRAEFDRAMVEYLKRKESGEDEETEDESDFEFDE